MRVAVVHNAVSAEATADERDVLVQVEAVSAALGALGHEPVALPCTLETDQLARQLASLKPNAVFNLVESLGGSDRQAALAAELFDRLGLPYTGVPAAALALTTDKLRTKERLRDYGLPTPAWLAPGVSSQFVTHGTSATPPHPEGVTQQSPGSPSDSEAHPGLRSNQEVNPEGVPQAAGRESSAELYNPFRVDGPGASDTQGALRFAPRPWALLSNPFGVKTTLVDGNACTKSNSAALYIIKAIWEHASFGLDDSAIVEIEGADESRLVDQIEQRSLRLGRACFAEQYIEGREFNLSLLDGPDGPEVLPPAEIDFSTYPAGKPRIVGFEAKWDADSFEYDNTPRRFEFPVSDQELLARLSELARRCWTVFGLSGYARVDFRVDDTGSPWILEVNANPCLSPDAGFAAAVEQASLGYERAVQRIVNAAMTGRRT